MQHPSYLTRFLLPVAALLLPAAAAALAPAENPPEPGAQQIEFFETRVRPVLAARCYACHSGKAAQPMGELRVDGRALLLRGGARGPALTPGKPEESLLIKAIRFDHPGLQMPPGSKMPAAEIEALTEWVRMGAPWPSDAPAPPAGSPTIPVTRDPARVNHWAYLPLRRPAPPRPAHAAGARNEIDHFLLNRLAADGLKPAPEADRRTLIRRLSFDLTGLPPGPDEVHDFLADSRPDAYERLVDRLLASPHFGERWGRHWLDLVRYAETDGHEFDFEKPFPWRYRDYVIRALNADLPFDQFAREHVAGDLLPHPRRSKSGENESLLATGFWWLGEGKHSPVDLLEDEAERTDNQIDVFGKAFLGLSLGCARCHDHKFDAISAADYYSLSAYLRSSRYAVKPVNDPQPWIARRDEFQALNRRLSGPLAAAAAQARLPAAGRFSKLLQAAREALAAGGKKDALERAAAAQSITPAELETVLKHLAGAAMVDPSDPLHAWAILSRTPPEEFAAAAARLTGAPGRFRIFETFDEGSFTGWFVDGSGFGEGGAGAPAVRPDLARPGGIEAIIPAGSADSARYGAGFTGALRSRTFVIDSDRIWFRTAGRDARINLIIDGFQRIRYPIYGGLTLEAEGAGALKWRAMDVAKWRGHRAYIEIIDNGRGWIAVDEIVMTEGGAQPPAPAAAAGAPDQAAKSMEAAVTSALRRLAQSSDLEQVEGAELELAAWAVALLPGAPAALPGDASAALQRLAALERELPEPLLAMTILDGDWQQQPIYRRGSPRTPGDLVHARFLEVIGGPNQTPLVRGSGRLEMARLLTSRRNPLLARVIVNRLWQHLFGEGLVRTPDDFGLRGERPSHPELLEWLASQFVRDGWSIKKSLRRMLVTSAYRRSGIAPEATLRKDPSNILLGRMPVRRLEAEAIRDAMLAVSGRLDRTLYGPPVPPELTPFMSGRGRPEQSGPVDGGGRRSIYIGVRRNFLVPLFTAFDYPIPFNSMGRRSVSTVPAQALTLLNNPLVIQQAGVWARRVLQEAPKDRKARIRWMYEAAFAREASNSDIRNARLFLELQEKEYGAADDPRAWSDLAHVLFNTKEFIFIG